MKNKFNFCSCGQIIEDTEIQCQDCYNYDIFERESTDMFLDELSLEKEMDTVILNNPNISISRKYFSDGSIKK